MEHLPLPGVLGGRFAGPLSTAICHRSAQKAHKRAQESSLLTPEHTGQMFKINFKHIKINFKTIRKRKICRIFFKIKWHSCS